MFQVHHDPQDTHTFAQQLVAAVAPVLSSGATATGSVAPAYFEGVCVCGPDDAAHVPSCSDPNPSVGDVCQLDDARTSHADVSHNAVSRPEIDCCQDSNLINDEAGLCPLVWDGGGPLRPHQSSTPHQPLVSCSHSGPYILKFAKCESMQQQQQEKQKQQQQQHHQDVSCCPSRSHVTHAASVAQQVYQQLQLLTNQPAVAEVSIGDCHTSFGRQ